MRLATSTPPRPPKSGRRAHVILLALSLAMFTCETRIEAAEEGELVPIGLQVQLLDKIAAYDRKLPERSGGRVRLMVVSRAGSAESERASAQLHATLAATPSLGGYPHDDSDLKFVSAEALAAACRSGRVSILYFTPGFKDDLQAIRAALDGVSVLSVSTVGTYVQGGIVLGFDLISGKPRLLFNLTQAKRQNVAMRPEVIRLMRVYE
jgi:YfiR/HmsC-like